MGFEPTSIETAEAARHPFKRLCQPTVRQNLQILHNSELSYDFFRKDVQYSYYGVRLSVITIKIFRFDIFFVLYNV